MKIEVGKTYNFDPPLEAAGHYWDGKKTSVYRRLLFKTGECVEIDSICHKFRGTYGGETYLFFANPPEGTTTLIEHDNPPLL